MRQIVFDEPISELPISFSSIVYGTPIFARKKGILKGMIVKEDAGWILKVGGFSGAYGHFSELIECIKHGINEYGYTFVVEG